MPAITVHNDESLNRMWAVHLDAERAAEDAKKAAADLQDDADQLRADAISLEQQATEIRAEAERRATEILNEAQQRSAAAHKAAQEKDEASKQALRMSADAVREETRQRALAKDFSATVDLQADLNSNLTHPMHQQPRPPRPAETTVVDAFTPPPMPSDNGAARTAGEIADALVANGPLDTQAMPATPPGTEQAP